MADEFTAKFDPRSELTAINDNFRTELADAKEDATQQLNIRFKVIHRKLDLIIEMEKRIVAGGW
jgi:hypothetical protein